MNLWILWLGLAFSGRAFASVPGAPPAPEATTDAATASNITLDLATREAAYRRLMAPESTVAVLARLKASDLDPQQRWVLIGLYDPALLVHAAALDALIQLKDPSALADLALALVDAKDFYRGTSFRQKIVRAEAACGKDGARYLVKALTDKDPEVLALARSSLEAIAGFSYREGRTPDQEAEAWRRWAER